MSRAVEASITAKASGTLTSAEVQDLLSSDTRLATMARDYEATLVAKAGQTGLTVGEVAKIIDPDGSLAAMTRQILADVYVSDQELRDFQTALKNAAQVSLDQNSRLLITPTTR